MKILAKLLCVIRMLKKDGLSDERIVSFLISQLQAIVDGVLDHTIADSMCDIANAHDRERGAPKNLEWHTDEGPWFGFTPWPRSVFRGMYVVVENERGWKAYRSNERGWKAYRSDTAAWQGLGVHVSVEEAKAACEVDWEQLLAQVFQFQSATD